MMIGFRSMRWNSWRWRPLLEKWGHLRVMIDPDILKTTAFLLVNDEPVATVFFVRWFLDTNGLTAYYAVTARHAIRHPIVSIRFNRYKGDTEPQFFNRSDWHECPPTDIAILPLDSPPNPAYDIRYLDTHCPEAMFSEAYPPPSYSTGDETFTVGLFEGHTGQGLTHPVARFGHIALKPAQGEQILADIDPPDLTPIDAFLVEMATWAGQSGSPVFLNVPWSVKDRMLPEYAPERNYLIGMVQGFYPGEQRVKINKQDAKLSTLQMGIGIVIPTKDICEALMKPSLVEQRDKLRRDRQQNPTIRPSAASNKT